MILKAEMQTVGDKTVIGGLCWYASDRYGLQITVGWCRSGVFNLLKFDHISKKERKVVLVVISVKPRLPTHCVQLLVVFCW